MVLATGPRVATEAVRAPKRVEVRQFINRIYELFAAWIIIPSTPQPLPGILDFGLAGQ